ncbi:hypothetical protein [Limnofasciculus baicalensis]|uniref:Uncharacterized protein n=1 Tax=Limnofasciculus baicalensis BBK-W-15 TaxID=2699891 RepID=A0AAE3GM91_9CYAN|nr:hypothetical protein [Limnofasciculus baicalensis]MCP2726964.1 hypothetical protein [Limnofasciculus baicalensis BBK-W-15]
MKKLFAFCLAIILAMGAASLPASAENSCSQNRWLNSENVFVSLKPSFDNLAFKPDQLFSYLEK